MTIVRSRGFDIAYEATGSGPAVVLLPGVMMPRTRWRQAGYVEALAERYTVITVDPLGLGESSQILDPGAYRADLLALDTIAVLDQEGVEQAVLSGGTRVGLVSRLMLPRCSPAGSRPSSPAVPRF